MYWQIEISITVGVVNLVLEWIYSVDSRSLSPTRNETLERSNCYRTLEFHRKIKSRWPTASSISEGLSQKQMPTVMRRIGRRR